MDKKDIISRQAVLDIALKYCPDDDGTCSEAGSDLRNMLDEIEALPPAGPKKMHWKTKMSIRHINGAVCYIPKWYCPKCDLEYDPYFAQQVNFCYACGQWIEDLVDVVKEVTE